MSVSSRLRFSIAAVMTLVSASAIALVMSATISHAAALSLVALTAAVAALVVGLLVLRRVERLTSRGQREAERRRGDTERLLERQDKILEAVANAQAELVAGLESKLSARVEASEAAVRKQLEDSARKRDRQYRRILKHITMTGRHDYEQQVCWYQLHELLSPKSIMPALRGWAASPDVICTLVEEIAERRPKLVVECGSGASSVWLGLALERFGGGRLVALEHDADYAALSRALVAKHGLSDRVEVRDATLKPWSESSEGEPQPWYDLRAVEDLAQIDMLLIDGPPEGTGKRARYPAGPVLFPKCAAECFILLDDADRDDERESSEAWAAQFTDFRSRSLATEKGARVFVRGS